MIFTLFTMLELDWTVQNIVKQQYKILKQTIIASNIHNSMI